MRKRSGDLLSLRPKQQISRAKRVRGMRARHDGVREDGFRFGSEVCKCATLDGQVCPLSLLETVVPTPQQISFGIGKWWMRSGDVLFVGIPKAASA